MGTGNLVVILVMHTIHPMNLHRFGLFANRPHSAGGVYIAINDLPRDARYLQVNCICPMIMPGVAEPNNEQLNHCMEVPVNELIQLKKGTSFDCSQPKIRRSWYLLQVL